MTDVTEDNCPEWSTMLHAFVDGELDSVHAAQFEGHLATCRQCAAELERLKAMRALLGQEGVKWQAPAEVRTRVLTAIATDAPFGFSPGLSGEAPWRRALRFVRQWSFIPSLAALAASIFIVMSAPGEDTSLRDQIVASHVRSLLADHLTDVQTSDQHTVKPWFNGRLDFSPPVVDLAAQGFPLVGGRVDYIGDRVVAALVYRRHGHMINVFVWPGAPELATESTHDGYNISEWSGGGMTFWAISDVNSADLAAFREGFQQQAGM
ncbi:MULTISPECIES: anti-sigma factor [unclassified Sinorhizobium]|uniref:anti-sigma factor family protein n=1 Tax=unclassified Sinorhizobium TaxID=2613772 RepID=UPI003525DA4F